MERGRGLEKELRPLKGMVAITSLPFSLRISAGFWEIKEEGELRHGVEGSPVFLWRRGESELP